MYMFGSFDIRIINQNSHLNNSNFVKINFRNVNFEHFLRIIRSGLLYINYFWDGTVDLSVTSSIEPLNEIWL